MNETVNVNDTTIEGVIVENQHQVKFKALRKYSPFTTGGMIGLKLTKRKYLNLGTMIRESKSKIKKKVVPLAVMEYRNKADGKNIDHYLQFVINDPIQKEVNKRERKALRKIAKHATITKTADNG